MQCNRACFHMEQQRSKWLKWEFSSYYCIYFARVGKIGEVRFKHLILGSLNRKAAESAHAAAAAYGHGRGIAGARMRIVPHAGQRGTFPYSSCRPRTTGIYLPPPALCP